MIYIILTLLITACSTLPIKDYIDPLELVPIQDEFEEQDASCEYFLSVCENSIKTKQQCAREFKKCKAKE